MTEPRYRIEVTAKQAKLLRDACSLLARCRMGQIGAACQEVLDQDGKASVNYYAANFFSWRDRLSRELGIVARNLLCTDQ